LEPHSNWRDEVINDIKKLKLRNWIQLIKDRKAWNDTGAEDQNPCRVLVLEEE